jgi:peptide deformylase
MAELLKIAQLGHPVLRQQAEAIADPLAPAIQTLIDNLLATLQQANGVGMAAPQVAQPLQLLIVASRPNPRYPHAPQMEPTAMINPRLLAHADVMVKDWEGCLSIPGIRGLVPRYPEIEVEYIGRDGTCHRRVLTDFVARIFQHEFDHLNGVMFVDRMVSTQDLITEQEYQRRINELGNS